MCEKFGTKPHEYLFNDLIPCAHTRLAIDMTVYNVWSNWHDKQEQKRIKKMKEEANRAKMRGGT